MGGRVIGRTDKGEDFQHTKSHNLQDAGPYILLT